MTTVHDIKVWPDYFDRIEDGSKPFEIRKNDRDYHVGDVLNLQEYAPGPDEYTGRYVVKRVSFLISGDDPMGFAFGLRPGFVALGLNAVAPSAGVTAPKTEAVK